MRADGIRHKTLYKKNKALERDALLVTTALHQRKQLLPGTRRQSRFQDSPVNETGKRAPDSPDSEARFSGKYRQQMAKAIGRLRKQSLAQQLHQGSLGHLDTNISERTIRRHGVSGCTSLHQFCKD
jgi:hypothetical protein